MSDRDLLVKLSHDIGAISAMLEERERHDQSRCEGRRQTIMDINKRVVSLENAETRRKGMYIATAGIGGVMATVLGYVWKHLTFGGGQ